MKRFAMSAATFAIVLSMAGAMAQPLTPTTMFDGDTTLGTSGAARAAHIIVQSWTVTDQEQEMPLRGFFLAHVMSGQIAATVDGLAAEHLPGDYWTVKPGATMRIRAIGEVAVVETTVVAKR